MVCILFSKGLLLATQVFFSTGFPVETRSTAITLIAVSSHW